MWKEEVVSQTFKQTVFVMLFKNKGNPNDPSKYRCIGLLNHTYTYKVLSTIILSRVNKETRVYLKDWQAGFRQQRGCRDNIHILNTLFDHVLTEGKHITVTCIDYSTAFGSVSHKFIDQTLKEAGARPETRTDGISCYKHSNKNHRTRWRRNFLRLFPGTERSDSGRHYISRLLHHCTWINPEKSRPRDRKRSEARRHNDPHDRLRRQHRSDWYKCRDDNTKGVWNRTWVKSWHRHVNKYDQNWSHVRAKPQVRLRQKNHKITAIITATTWTDSARDRGLDGMKPRK